MVVMTAACLARLLLVLYVCLDFANPLMPGAVTFDADESVEGVRAERSRADGEAAAVVPVPAAEHLRPAPVVGVAARPRPGLDLARAHLVMQRPTRPRAADPAPPGDDH
jgi:hypothetical protein